MCQDIKENVVYTMSGRNEFSLELYIRIHRFQAKRYDPVPQAQVKQGNP